MPIQNIIVHAILNGKIRTAKVNRTPVIKITMNKGTMEINKFIVDESTLETGKIYFGIYTFVINEALPTMDISPMLVDSEKKLKNTIQKTEFLLNIIYFLSYPLSFLDF